MRIIADGMRHEAAREMLLRLAHDYDKIAAMVEKGVLSATDNPHTSGP
jgi:hypothetical protein